MSKDSNRKFIVIGGVILCVILVGVIVFLSLNQEGGSPEPEVEAPTTFPADPVLDDINIVDPESDENADPLTIVDQNNSVEVDYSDPVVTSDFVQDDIASDGTSSDEDLAFLLEHRRTNPSSNDSGLDTEGDSEEADLFQERLDEILSNPTQGMSEDMIAFLGEDFVIAQSGDDVLNNAENEAATQQNIQDWIEQRQADGFAERNFYESDSSTYNSCGSVEIDVDSDATENEVISELSDDSAAMCIADKFLGDCDATTVEFDGSAYLLDTVNDVCSFGKMVSGFINICATTDDPEDFSSDLTDFQKGSIVLDLVNKPSSDCAVYRY